jgi:hypothetical protein
MTVDSGIKNRKSIPPVCGSDSRFSFGFHFSFVTSQGDVKGTDLFTSIRRGGLSGFAPLGAVLDDPVRERALETDVVTGLFGLDPFVAQDFLAFRLKFAVKRGVLQQITRRR